MQILKFRTKNNWYVFGPVSALSYTDRAGVKPTVEQEFDFIINGADTLDTTYRKVVFNLPNFNINAVKGEDVFDCVLEYESNQESMEALFDSKAAENLGIRICILTNMSFYIMNHKGDTIEKVRGTV